MRQRHQIGCAALLALAACENAPRRDLAAGTEVTPQGRSVGSAATVTVAAGGDQTCALASDGNAFCWGQRPDRPPDNGRTPQRTAPESLVPPPDSGGWRSLSLAAGAACGLSTRGTLLCWGRNEAGRVILPADGRYYSTPLPVIGAPPLATVATSTDHACGLTERRVLCWGRGTAGQLGDGRARTSEAPVVTRLPLKSDSRRPRAPGR